VRVEASELLRKVELYEREQKTIIEREKARVREEVEFLEGELHSLKEENREMKRQINDLHQ
jgi:cell division protein FtsB